MSSKQKLFLLFITIFSSSLFISPSISTTNSKANDANFVKKACDTTTYPSLCRKTCVPKASDIAGDNRKLANTALYATLTAAKSAKSEIKKLSQRKGLSKYEANVVSDCIEHIGGSINYIKQSMDQIKDLKSSDNGDAMRFKVSNIQTWMSACITNENTCMDAIEEGNVSPSVRDKLMKYVLRVVKHTSNALSLCNRLQS